MFVDNQTGELYVGQMRLGDREATPEEVGAYEESRANSVPQIIEPLQGLLAIEAAGLAEAYDAWSKSEDRSFSERAFIEKAKVWRRDDPILTEAAKNVLGLVDAEIDALFIDAATR